MPDIVLHHLSAAALAWPGQMTFAVGRIGRVEAGLRFAHSGTQEGSIACTSFVSAQRGGGIFGGPRYSAAKAGVLGLAKAMARELGPDNIRVNRVTPGLIQTDITGDKLTDTMRADIIKGSRSRASETPATLPAPFCSWRPTFRPI